jgi:amino acid adenylation domain-containing protein
VDLRNLPEPEREAEAQQLATEEARRPFDLAQGPLLRAILLRLDKEEHVLLLTMHHIVSDGWSMGILFRELSALYGAFSVGKPSPLPELPIQYADFAVWQRQWLQGEVLEAQLAYWRKQLDGAPSMLELPTDRPRPAVQTSRGARQSLALSRDLTEALKVLSRQEGVTLFMTLLAAFKTLLYRYAGRDDIIVVSPIANRNRVEIEGLIGFFVNTLVLHTDLSGNPSFRELLGRVREVALGAYAHQDLPFEKLVEELQPERDLSHTPLFQVWFVLQNTPRQALKLPGLTVNPLKALTETAKFDLTLSMVDTEQGLIGALGYNTDLFDAATIERMAGHFQTLLEGIVTDPEQRLSDLPLSTESEQHQQFIRGNLIRPTNPFVEFRRAEIEQSIPDRFEQQAKKYPKNIAVKTENDEWTYEALNQTANRIAQTILALCGRGEERIALLFEHDAPMIAGLLGVLKAGKTYVPLDPSYPKERLAYILENSQASAVLTNKMNRSLAKELTKDTLQLINIDDIDFTALIDDINLHISPDTVAYLLYTSGSTGQPKGVMQNHRNVLHHIRTYTNNLHISVDDRLTLLSSYSFDAAVMDIFGALLNGATLYPINIKGEGFANLPRWFIEQEFTIYHSTPTAYRYFINSLTDGEIVPTFRLVVLGGEEVHKRDVELYKKHFLPECIFINGLGPTESTVSLQYFINHDTEITRNAVPVGYPVENTEILLLNGAGEEAGVYGEIAIRSPHIALGYWQKPEITKAAFLPDPEGGEKRIYRTGDMGRLLPNGGIEFVGRKDFQVKIRGFRIELGEIEAVLGEHLAVRETVVLTGQDGPGEKHLVAYVVPHQEQAPTTSELRSFLKTKLPEYMVPSAFVMLEALPLTPTGKIDRRALPAPDAARPKLEKAFVAPRDTLELQMTKIWEQVLGLQPIGVRDNFFELGGHSLLAVRLFAQIEKVFGTDVPLATLFQAPTVEQLANVLRQTGWSAPWSSLVAIQPGGSKRPFFCVPGNLGNVFADLGDLAQHLGLDQPFYGLQDSIRNPVRIEALAAYYLDEIRAVQPGGPYLLGGVCSGGVLAFEMAQQLQAQGQQVALLALVEPSSPHVPGLRAYFNLAAVSFRRFVRRFSLHSRNVSQLGSAEQRAYLRLKAKLFANSWALRRYAPEPYPNRIHLFLTSESLKSPHNPQLDWRKLAAGGVEVREIPGNHNTITGANDTKIEKAHMQVLAEQLSVCIDEVLTDDDGT